MILAFDLHAFLGFDGLMQAVRPTPARHHAPRKFVDDDDFAVFDHILHVAAIEGVRLDRSLDMMLERPVLRVGNISDPK